MKNVFLTLALAFATVSCNTEVTVDEGANTTDTLEVVTDSVALEETETVEVEGVEASAE
jgi:hypothetical protein